MDEKCKLRASFYMTLFCMTLAVVFASLCDKLQPLGISIYLGVINGFWTLGMAIFAIFFLIDFVDWNGE